jgi:hypothetical protein
MLKAALKPPPGNAMLQLSCTSRDSTCVLSCLDWRPVICQCVPSDVVMRPVFGILHYSSTQFTVETIYTSLYVAMQLVEKLLVKLGHGLGLPSRYKLLKKIGAVSAGVRHPHWATAASDACETQICLWQHSCRLVLVVVKTSYLVGR